MTSSNPNIRLRYLYRDGGNYKNHGTVVLSNPLQRSLPEVDAFLKVHLHDQLFFVAADWGLPDVHFTQYPYDEAIDHDWHEYAGVEATTETAEDNLEVFRKRVVAPAII